MTDADQQAAFIQAICESPHDDGHRDNVCGQDCDVAREKL